MAVEESTQSAADEIKQLEKKLLPYQPYKGEVTITQALELEPREYVDLTYQDLLSMYERSEKIRSAMGLPVFGTAAGAGTPGVPQAPAALPVPTTASTEVESRLKEMTTETLQRAEQVSGEPSLMEGAEAPRKEEDAQKPYEMEIEFEHKALERPVEPQAKAAPEAQKKEAETPGPAEAIEPALGMSEEKKMVVANVPPVLRENPDEAAGRRYDQMEEHVREMLGGAADEVSIKKKMLELTKELFKEKSFDRREQLKLQISVMKNMLVGGIPARKKKAAGEEETHGRLLDTIISTQQAELAQTKDTVISSYNRQIDAIRVKFYDDIASVEEPQRRKEIFDAFVFSVTSLVEQLPGVLRKYQDYTAKKHAAEVEKVLGSLGEGEKETAARASERLEHIRSGYDAEFAPVKRIIGSEIESLVDSAGNGVFESAAKEGEESKMLETVGEINATDEGTLLNYLRSKDAGAYAAYEGKQTSKAEAAARAKAIMAREKGLSASMIRKYFNETDD
jgi:hypothetical protein